MRHRAVGAYDQIGAGQHRRRVQEGTVGVQSVQFLHGERQPAELFRRGARILAAWPLRPQLELRTSWKWAGRSYRLTRGRYRWFAWAGFGRRSAARYKLLGSAKFIVAQS